MTPSPIQKELLDLRPYFSPQEIAEIERIGSAPRKEEPIPLDFAIWLVNASPTFTWHWKHQAQIRYYLSSVDRGEIDRLAITCPPRHGKSELVTIRRPAHRLELDPSRRFIIGAHSSKLAMKFSRRTRGIVRQRGRVKLSRELQQAENWETEAGGGLMAAGVSTGIAGHGANEIILDDPVKSRAEANSQAYRDACWDWYTDDLYTRLEPDGTIILIMTRWHESDLMGRIMESADGKSWTLCHMPALAEHDDDLGRAPGEALCSERYDEKRLARIKAVMGASFDALYQGRPSAQEGNIILSEWFRYYDYPEREYRQKVQSWDTANKDKQLNDWNVCTTWGIHSVNYDLLAERRERLTYPRLKQAVVEEAEAHHPDAILIEDRGNGTAVLQDLGSTTLLPLIPIEPVGDKVMRLSNESGAYEAGLVRHPRHKIAHWIAPFESELITIPSSTYDDRGDSVSQFLKWVKRHGSRMSYEVLRAEEPLASYEQDNNAGYGIVRAGNYYD